MSVIVKGMDMPKKCICCPLSHWNKLDELTGCELHQKYIPNAEKEFWEKDRPDWCPLAEVKHGKWGNRGKWLNKEITADFHVIGKCSVCKERRRIDNFCPNCGADMRGGT